MKIQLLENCHQFKKGWIVEIDERAFMQMLKDVKIVKEQKRSKNNKKEITKQDLKDEQISNIPKGIVDKQVTIEDIQNKKQFKDIFDNNQFNEKLKKNPELLNKIAKQNKKNDFKEYFKKFEKQEKKKKQNIQNIIINLCQKYGIKDNDNFILYFENENHHCKFRNVEYDILGIWFNPLLKELCFYGLDGNEQGMFFTFGDLQDHFIEEIWKTEIENFENEIIG